MKTVRDVMTRSVLSVGPDTPLKDVARVLIDKRISGLPVVDDEAHVLGVVSEGDLLVKEQKSTAVHHRPLARVFGESEETKHLLAKAEARTAGDSMSSPAITIEPDASVQTAATLMIAHKVNRLPVIEDGKLVGIVTRADVIRTFVQSDEELVQEIRSEILVRRLWVDPAQFTVEVANGVATIHGRVGRRSTAAMVGHMVETLPGIVGVNADVEWSIDDRDVEAPDNDYFSPKPEG